MTPHCHAADNTHPPITVLAGWHHRGESKSWEREEERSGEAHAQMFMLIVGMALQTAAGVTSADGLSQPRSTGSRRSPTHQTARHSLTPPVFSKCLYDDLSPALPRLTAAEESFYFI